MTDLHVDLCVIGGGAAGLSVAAGAVQLGFDVALAERGAMGGECLNSGCVPSKALIAAARAAHDAKKAQTMGVTAAPAVDFPAVAAHIQRRIARIAPHDSVERFEGLGVKVIRESVSFTTPRSVVTTSGRKITARYFVIATGAAPHIPAIPGLDPARVLTNETLFTRDTVPAHLMIIGAGPMGVEMAQAFRRLGARVTVIARTTILPRHDPDVAALMRKHLLEEDDIRVIERGHIIEAQHHGAQTVLCVEGIGEIKGDTVLVAAGRAPRVADLNLPAAGVAFTADGITVDRHLRAGPRHIFALGDVAGGVHAGPRLTSIAGYQAGIVIRNMMFRLPARVDYAAAPHVVFTDPEIAQIGLTHAAALEKFGKRARATIWSYRENDRAVIDGRATGFVKIVTVAGGRVVGATLAGPQAGEQSALWTLAVARRMNIRHIAALPLAYPTYAEAGKRAAGAYFSSGLFGGGTRLLVGLLQRLP